VIEKYSVLRGVSDGGSPLIHLVEPGSGHGLRETEGLAKVASHEHLPEVTELVESISPQPGRLYLLNSALGAGEYVGFNLRSDWFRESGLVHEPPGWKDVPVWDVETRRKLASAPEHVPGWGELCWGYPTFYNAHRYRHHCFPAGTPVLMGDRRRISIEDVQVGNEVATRNGPRPVTRVFCDDYVGEGIALTLAGKLEPLVGTPDHEVLVLRRGQVHCRHKYNRLGQSAHSCPEFRRDIGEAQWVPLIGIEPGDYLLTPLPPEGKTEVSADFAALVGWVAADGHLGANGTVAFTFHPDSPKIEQVLLCIEANGAKPRVHTSDFYNRVQVSFTSAVTWRELARYISGVKAEKTLLGGVLDWGIEARLALLEAFIDGDGHIPVEGRNEGQLRIRSSSPQMLYVLSDVIRSLGADCTLNFDSDPKPFVSPLNGKAYQGSGSGCVALGASYVQELLQCSRRKHVRQARGEGKKGRKVRRLGPYAGCVLCKVLDVSGIDLTEQVYNLEVEGDHEYVANEVVVHNCNSDPNRAYGYILGAFWDPRMHRVILVSELVEDMCCRLGAQDVYNRIKAGEFVDTSMGLKTPFDECSLCHNQARSPSVYCRHLNGTDPRYGLGKLLPDGRVCGTYTDYPRFFDDSFVFVGAEKSAKVLSNLTQRVKGNRPYTQKVYGQPSRSKTASAPTPGEEQRERVTGVLAGIQAEVRTPEVTLSQEERLSRALSGMPRGSRRERDLLDYVAGKQRRAGSAGAAAWGEAARRYLRREHAATDNELEEVARQLDERIRTPGSEKSAALPMRGSSKLAEMLKRIPAPSPSHLSTMRAHEAAMPSLPKSALEMMAESPGPSIRCAARLGVVLRPDEFQYVMMRGSDPEAAEEMRERGVTFCPKPLDPSADPTYQPNLPPPPEVLERVTSLLRDLLAERSIAPAAVRIRITRVLPAGPQVPPPAGTGDGDLLGKVAALYNEYRAGLLLDPPDWRYVPVGIAPMTDLSEEEELARKSQELSQHLLCLAHWPALPVG